MIFEAVWAKAHELLGTKLPVVVIVVVIGILYLTLDAVKGKKAKRLMADARFKDAKIFKSGDFSIFVSPSGYAGIITALSKPQIVNIKDVKEYAVVSDGRIIAGGNKNGTIFEQASLKVADGLKEPAQAVELVLKLNNENPALNITLYSRASSKGGKTAMNDTAQNEIKQLLSALENAEKDINAIGG